MASQETRLLFRKIDEPGLASIDTYRKLGGYRSIEKAFKQMTPEEVLKELEDSGLRGRGGAGFSMGKKASFLPRGDMDKYLCCNADESEPGAFKDRELIQKNPHQLIEGLIIAARAAGANRCFIYIRGEYDLQGDILDTAVEEAYEAGFLGEDVLGTGEQVELVVHRGAGAYICGEETALLDSLEGKRGNPRLEASLPRRPGPLRRADPDQQRRDALQRPAHRRLGCRLVQELRDRAVSGDQGRLGLRRREAARQLRGRARHPDQGPDRGPRGRPAGRPARSRASSRAAPRHRS